MSHSGGAAILRGLGYGASALVAAAILSMAPARAQIAKSLLVEDGPMPGAPMGHTVDSLSNTAVNHTGGFAVSTNSSDGMTTLSHIWGSITPGSGTVIRTEGTFGIYQQTSFESFYGISDSGEVGYSALSTSTVTGTTSLDGVWVDDEVVAIEEEPAQGVPGFFWSFGSRPGVTSGGTPYWVGGITDTSGGGTQNRGLFFSNLGTPLLLGGFAVPGLPFVLNINSVSFDYRFSMDATNYIAEVQMESGSSSNDGAMVLTGAGLMVGGGLVREGDAIPAGVPGVVLGEAWDNFDFTGVTEGGSWFFSGDTDGSSSVDEIVVRNGSIVLREEDAFDGEILDGSIEGGYQNEDGDLALIWDIETGEEVLILNDRIVIREGDPVDLDGDGVVEPTSLLANFTGISALTVSDRRPQGPVVIYFTADIDTMGTSSSSDDVEGYFLIETMPFVSPLAASVDAKPGLCPNAFRLHGAGVLPVSLLGTYGFDASEVDLTTVRLERADGLGGQVLPLEDPAGPGSVFGDRSLPYQSLFPGCHSATGDGMEDLTFFFDADDAARILGLDVLLPGMQLELRLAGNRLDGSPFEGNDFVEVVAPQADNLHVTNALDGDFVSVQPYDLNGDTSGFGTFGRSYAIGETVTLTAPLIRSEGVLAGWSVDGTIVQTVDPLVLTISGDHDVRPLYRRPFGAPRASVTTPGWLSTP